MILTGINKFIDNFEKSTDYSTGRTSVLTMENTSDYIVIQFKDIKIGDTQKWHVGRESALRSTFMNGEEEK